MEIWVDNKKVSVTHSGSVMTVRNSYGIEDMRFLLHAKVMLFSSLKLTYGKLS